MCKETAGNGSTYAAPEIKVRGSLNELTRGGSVSGNLDASYPVGTPSNYGGGLFSPTS